jgi:zinc/manganese transport system substrate-binding protein
MILAGSAVAQLEVVATQPDLADIASRIGGEHVDVESLTAGSEDLHLVRTRPSLLIKLRRADVFIQLGLDAEHAWVPALLQSARNDRISPGRPGFVNCAVGQTPLRVPASTSRADGPDIHPRGNPHYNLDPERMRIAAHHIRDGLKRVLPDRGADFDRRCASWEEELDRRLVAWTATMAPFENAAFVEDHDAWVYFADRFNLKIVGRLEAKPGLSPTAEHIAHVIADARARGVRLVVTRPTHADLARKVADEIGGEAVTLTLSSTEGGATGDYFAFMDVVVKTFATHLKKP